MPEHVYTDDGDEDTRRRAFERYRFCTSAVSGVRSWELGGRGLWGGRKVGQGTKVCVCVCVCFSLFFLGSSFFFPPPPFFKLGYPMDVFSKGTRGFFWGSLERRKPDGRRPEIGGGGGGRGRFSSFDGGCGSK